MLFALALFAHVVGERTGSASMASQHSAIQVILPDKLLNSALEKLLPSIAKVKSVAIEITPEFKKKSGSKQWSSDIKATMEKCGVLPVSWSFTYCWAAHLPPVVLPIPLNFS